MSFILLRPVVISLTLLTHIFLIPPLLFGEESLASKDADPIYIGVVYALSGPGVLWGEMGQMGLTLAQEEINKAGGVNRHRIQLIFEDSQTNPTKSVSAYQKLTTLNKIKIVIGDVWSFLTNPLISLAEKDQVLLISPTVMPESVERDSINFFSMGERIASVRSAVDLFFKRNPEVKTVGIFCWEDPWGQAYLKVWREVAIANDVKISGEICSFDFASDFRSDVAKIAAKQVDAVIIAYYSDVILKRMKEQKFSAKVLGSGAIVEDIKGKNFPAELFEGVYLTDWRPSDEFITKFKNRFHREPIVEAHNSYEALHSLAKALKLGGPNLVSAFRRVKYQGVAGPIDFTQSNYGNNTIAQLFRVERGEIQEVR